MENVQPNLKELDFLFPMKMNLSFQLAMFSEGILLNGEEGEVDMK